MKAAGNRALSSASLIKQQRTEVYDLYWRFAAERQAIFFKRLEGGEPPWTSDFILRGYKFTNAYRASDRVSQFLIREVIYNERYSSAPQEVIFRILLFKIFNKITTWWLLEDRLGSLTWQSFDIQAYDRVLSIAAAEGIRIYSAAYIIPPVSLDQSRIKHRGHLRLIETMLQGDFVARLQQTADLREVYLILKSYPSFGPFLAFQLAIDLNYSCVINHNEADFVVAGPGAQDGLKKTFPNMPQSAAEDMIAVMMDAQGSEFDRLGIDFRSLWGRPLQLVDCQNLFCEISKYTRVSNPEISGLSGRTRIKQVFKPQAGVVQPWYPPKWGLNDKIPDYRLIPRTSDLFQEGT